MTLNVPDAGSQDPGLCFPCPVPLAWKIQNYPHWTNKYLLFLLKPMLMTIQTAVPDVIL
jgi:hypothetical protein